MSTRAQESTASPLFEIDNEVTRRIRQHARASMTTEVCGVLIGQTREGAVQVIASIEASNAAQGGTHVTFTQDAWETIYRVKDVSYPDERIVGWYHSHPGFGVFLSEHDTFIHRNFFSSPDQVAWVYDPHTDEEGCFGWMDGEIHRISTFSIVDNNGDGFERAPKEEPALPGETRQSQPAEESKSRTSEGQPWVRWSLTALTYLVAVLFGFVIAFLLLPQYIFVPVDPITGKPLLNLPQAQASATPMPQATPAPPSAKSPADANSGGNK